MGSPYKVIITASLIALLLLAASVTYMVTNGCFYIEECGLLLNHHLSDKSVLWRIFYIPYIPRTESYVFRARELSYFFNLLDAQFIRICFQMGLPHFVSVTYLLSLLAIGIIHFYYSYNLFKYSANLFTALIFSYLVFLASPTVFYSTQYFRTGNILAGLFIFWQGWLLFSMIIRRCMIGAVDKPIVFSSLYFLVTTAAGLSGEQGLFITTALNGILFCWTMKYRTKTMWCATVAAICSLVLLACYRFYFGQFLITWVTGLKVQHREILSTNMLDLYTWFGVVHDAFDLLLHYFSNFLAQLPIPLILLFIVSLGVFMLYRMLIVERKWNSISSTSRLLRAITSPFAMLLYAIFMLWLMLIFMTVGSSQDIRFQMHSPYVALPFLKMWYYPLPITVLSLLMLSALMCYLSQFINEKKKVLFTVVIVLLLLGNLYSLRSNHTVMRSHGIARPYIAQQLIQAVYFSDLPVVPDGFDPVNSEYTRDLISKLRVMVHRNYSK